MQINIKDYSDENIEKFIQLVNKEEKLEIVVNYILPTSIFQVIVCNLEKFDLKIENEVTEKVFQNIVRID